MINVIMKLGLPLMPTLTIEWEIYILLFDAFKIVAHVYMYLNVLKMPKISIHRMSIQRACCREARLLPKRRLVLGI